MKKSERITFRTTEQLKKDIAHFAQIQGISSGHLIRKWIELFIQNQVLNSSEHYYELMDGTQYPDMKSLCKELKISSRTARKRVKTGVIKKINANLNQTQKYGEELQTANTRRTETNWI